MGLVLKSQDSRERVVSVYKNMLDGNEYWWELNVTQICVQLRHHLYSEISVVWLTQSVEHETLITGSQGFELHIRCRSWRV